MSRILGGGPAIPTTSTSASGPRENVTFAAGLSVKGPYTTAVYTQPEAIDAVWTLVSAGFIFLMQAGFALVESGAVSKKNRSAMLIKNLYNVIIAAVAFWLCGYGLAFAAPEFFVGNQKTMFASYGYETIQKDNYLHWILQFAYCTVVVGAYQGSLAERTNLSAYVIVSFLLASFVYPIILAWTWGKGWLYDNDFHDFAGSGIIHLVAGTTAFWGAWIVGERRAKIRVRENHELNNKDVNVKSTLLQNELNEINSDFSSIAKKHFAGSSGELKRNNTTFIVIGGLLIWASYIFFVGGRTMTQFNPRSSNPAKIIQNMFISSGFSALTTLMIKPIALGVTRYTKFDALSLSNGALVGMVAISASVDRVENWGAVLIGTISAFCYIISILTLEFFRIDDPLETISVHLSGGAWGLFAAGFFDTTSGALFYGALSQGKFMGFQLVGILTIFLFTSLIMFPAFFIMRKLHLLRADKAVEEIGFDVASIYPGVSAEFLKAVNEKIEAKEEQEKKLHEFDHAQHF